MLNTCRNPLVEDYAVKKSIFRETDAVANPDTILASSSSGLLMTEIQKATQRPGRCIIAHPFNPPHIVPLVEIIRGEKTSRETVEATRRFMAGLGKVQVLLNKEVLGYIANGLAAALWREAIDPVENDVASVEDVDKALSAGPGIRWALMGSHLTYHLAGGRRLGRLYRNNWQENLLTDLGRHENMDLKIRFLKVEACGGHKTRN